MLFVSASVFLLSIAACFADKPTDNEMVNAMIEAVEKDIFLAKPIAMRMTCAPNKPETLKFVGINPDNSDGVEVSMATVLRRIPEKKCKPVLGESKTTYGTECVGVFKTVITSYSMCEHAQKLNKFESCEALPQWFETRKKGETTKPKVPDSCTHIRALFAAMVEHVQELWKSDAGAKPEVKCIETNEPGEGEGVWRKVWELESVKSKAGTVTAAQIADAALRTMTLTGINAQGLIVLLRWQSRPKGLCSSSATGLTLENCAVLPNILGVPKSKLCSAN